MSHLTLTQSRMYQIHTREIETELGLDSMDKYIARRQLRWLARHVSRMRHDVCPMIVYPDVCSPLGYPVRDQGEPRRWPSAKQWSKHWKPLISIRSTVLAMAANRTNWRHIGSINDSFSYLLRRVDTRYPISTRINRMETLFPYPPYLLFLMFVRAYCFLSHSSWNLCSNRSWSNCYCY